jgi:hypothetical protein
MTPRAHLNSDGHTHACGIYPNPIAPGRAILRKPAKIYHEGRGGPRRKPVGSTVRPPAGSLPRNNVTSKPSAMAATFAGTRARGSDARSSILLLLHAPPWSYHENRPHIWVDDRTARKIDHRCTQMHADSIIYLSACICVHLWAKKSCFVGHERLHGGAEPPFSSITVLAQPLANSLLESFLLVPHDPAQQAHRHPSRGTRMGLSVQRAT